MKKGKQAFLSSVETNLRTRTSKQASHGWQQTKIVIPPWYASWPIYSWGGSKTSMEPIDLWLLRRRCHLLSRAPTPPVRLIQ